MLLDVLLVLCRHCVIAKLELLCEMVNLVDHRVKSPLLQLSLVYLNFHVHGVQGSIGLNNFSSRSLHADLVTNSLEELRSPILELV